METILSKIDSQTPRKTIQPKVVVLGSQGVGKSSIFLRYTDKGFNHHVSPTVGASFYSCNVEIEDTRVKLQVWDTAGQERFKSMVPLYYRNAKAAILVFDITQYHTFTAVKHWVKELNINVKEEVVIIIVGNKTDLSNGRKVPQEEALSYSDSVGACYFESSALQGEGIEDIILNLSKQLIVLSENSNGSSRKVDYLENSKFPFKCSNVPFKNHVILESKPTSEGQIKSSCC